MTKDELIEEIINMPGHYKIVIELRYSDPVKGLLRIRRSNITNTIVLIPEQDESSDSKTF